MMVEGMWNDLRGKSFSIRKLTLIIDDRSKDMCPICKTDKYLSPNMNFLINPECYHKICESCVDRIFSLGPAPCPYPKCGRMLRKNKFKKQVFDDLSIEKEIDIRKRVSGIYNKTEEDFESLKEYNKYLENLENVVFNLNNGIDMEETETNLVKYENEHKIEILEKNMRESQKNSDLTKYQESMARLKQEKLKIQKQMEIEDLEYQKQQKQELLDKLSSAKTANSDELISQSNNNLLKRSSLRKRQLQQVTTQLDQQFQNSNPFAEQAKEIEDETNRTPFTPFRGDREIHKRYNFLSGDNKPESVEVDTGNVTGTYYAPYLSNLAKDKQYLGGGWRLHSAFERALDEAFMGLGCFIDKEKT